MLNAPKVHREPRRDTGVDAASWSITTRSSTDSVSLTLILWHRRPSRPSAGATMGGDVSVEAADRGWPGV